MPTKRVRPGSAWAPLLSEGEEVPSVRLTACDVCTKPSGRGAQSRRGVARRRNPRRLPATTGAYGRSKEYPGNSLSCCSMGTPPRPPRRRAGGRLIRPCPWRVKRARERSLPSGGCASAYLPRGGRHKAWSARKAPCDRRAGYQPRAPPPMPPGGGGEGGGVVLEFAGVSEGELVVAQPDSVPTTAPLTTSN
jgi:hypothetical protein